MIANRAALVSFWVLAACSAPPAPLGPAPIALPDAATDAPIAVTVPDAAPPVPWLRGSTHVHARPSGDSLTEIPDVIAWYETHGYDFIVLTDHNRVSEVDGDTTGKVFVRAPATGLIVLAGVELTFNPNVCLPQEPPTKCRIHLNGLGVTARPVDKIEWADRKTQYRLDMYARGLGEIRTLGGIAQLNHPQWEWGMTGELLTELGRRGFQLVEIANMQFGAGGVTNWNAGDATHPSMEALWDDALSAGVDLWGVASDDAHHYQLDGGGKYPAGGGWVMVHADRDPDAIKAALAAGRFYASTGVTLARAEAEAGELVVEVDAASPGDHAIVFVSDGQALPAIAGRSARAAIPARGYIRAVVTRIADGAAAWVQPVRR